MCIAAQYAAQYAAHAASVAANTYIQPFRHLYTFKYAHAALDSSTWLNQPPSSLVLAVRLADADVLAVRDVNGGDSVVGQRGH